MTATNVKMSLKEITRANWREALTLSVTPEQQRFVGDSIPVAAIALAKAYIRPDGLIWVPYAIYADNLLIGLTMLAYEPDSSDQYWIYHFFIDQRYQGKGFGTEALATLTGMIKNSFCTCQVIQLTVHPENVAAQKLYTRGGFAPTGKTLNGEPVYRLKV